MRLASGKVDIDYLNFADWKDADKAPRHRLDIHDQYYCAPQVFYFRPQKKWYLIYQIADKDHKPPFGPACSTTTTLDDPKSWSKPRWLFPEGSPKHKWIDFWVICDREKAHLFYTSNDGHMWRAETKLGDFPGGWSEPVLALRADIFEASHTYRLKGDGKKQVPDNRRSRGDARRYYKAYLADRLEGPWRGLADSRDKPFASVANVDQDKAWTTNISHGELLRTGTDETMEVGPGEAAVSLSGRERRRVSRQSLCQDSVAAGHLGHEWKVGNHAGADKSDPNVFACCWCCSSRPWSSAALPRSH